MARQLAVHQEGALDVPVGAHHLLQLLGGEGVGQVGEAQQGVGGLQRHVDGASADSAVVEGADGILSLVPVQQSHKSWRRRGGGGSVETGDEDEGGEERDGRTCVRTHKCTFGAGVWGERSFVEMQDGDIKKKKTCRKINGRPNVCVMKK